jgi:quinolinate synthase
MNADIIKKIQELKLKNNAIILSHNYQLPEIQDIADFLGDSLDLAIKAQSSKAKTIIFCGVTFMAESAKILNPSKNVIIPDMAAQCPMANMVNIKNLLNLKNKHPTAKVVAYINTTSEAKIYSDICCTSANGVKVIKNIPSRKIIFIPDQNLGTYIQKQVPDKEIIIWPGFCLTHHKIRKQDILNLKNEHPKAEILVHPECKTEVIDIADYALSTNGMVNHVKKSDSTEFIIGTEKEICYRLKKENPKKEFYPIKYAICPNMKKITLNKVLKSLENLEPKIKLSNQIMQNAKKPLQRMIDISRGD